MRHIPSDTSSIAQSRILPTLTPERYEQMLPYIHKNFLIAQNYRVVERNLYHALHGWSLNGRSYDA